MVAKYTPGPWEASPSPSNRHVWRIYGTQWVGSLGNQYSPIVAETSSWLTSDPIVESSGNAALIAAAPELLEILRDTVACLEDRAYDNDERAERVLAEARAVVKKAITPK